MTLKESEQLQAKADTLKESEQLQAEADKYQRLADEARQRENAAVVSEIKALVKRHGLKPEDIFPGIVNAQVKSSTRQRREPRYRGPNGQLWGGGSGRVPDWVREIRASGESLEKYLIK